MTIVKFKTLIYFMNPFSVVILNGKYDILFDTSIVDNFVSKYDVLTPIVENVRIFFLFFFFFISLIQLKYILNIFFLFRKVFLGNIGMIEIKHLHK